MATNRPIVHDIKGKLSPISLMLSMLADPEILKNPKLKKIFDDNLPIAQENFKEIVYMLDDIT